MTDNIGLDVPRFLVGAELGALLGGGLGALIGSGLTAVNGPDGVVVGAAVGGAVGAVPGAAIGGALFTADTWLAVKDSPVMHTNIYNHMPDALVKDCSSGEQTSILNQYLKVIRAKMSAGGSLCPSH